MPFAEPLYGAGLIYLAGRYGVMVDALKSLRSKIFPRSGFGVDWSAVQSRYLLADNGHVHWAGEFSNIFQLDSNWKELESKERNKYDTS